MFGAAMRNYRQAGRAMNDTDPEDPISDEEDDEEDTSWGLEEPENIEELSFLQPPPELTKTATAQLQRAGDVLKQVRYYVFCSPHRSLG